MLRALLALSGIGILYGTLYPFRFAPPAADVWSALWSDANLWTSRGDLLGNVALFVPWGAAAMALALERHRRTVAALQALAAGAVFAVASQIAQLFVPARDAALGDAVWNTVGCALGMVAGPALQRAAVAVPASRERVVVVLLLVGSLVAELLPLVPSLDLALIKSQTHALLAGDLQISDAAQHMAAALLIGHLLRQVGGRLGSAPAFAAIIAAVMVAGLCTVESLISLSSLTGLVAGLAVGSSLRALAGPRQLAATAVALVAVYLVGALWPFSVRAEVGTFAWLPFGSLLQGSMLVNSQMLLSHLVLFAGVVQIAHAARSPVWAATWVSTLGVLAVELLQLAIGERSSDITMPLLALGAGSATAALLSARDPAHAKRVPYAGAWVARAADGVAAARGARPAAYVHAASGAETAATPQQPARPVSPAAVRPSKTARLWSLGVLLAMAAALHLLLRLPGIPYNVKELFRGDGNAAALLLFSMALLWLGVGPAWLGRALARSRRPGPLMAGGMFAVAMVSLALLALAVTPESLDDIAGSTNVYWFVVNRDMWGAAWRELFLRMEPLLPMIDFVERCIRFAALYGPLPIVLGSLVAWRERPRWSALHAAGLLAAAMMLLWLCKAIAFDWSSTDNLNELIARDGPWGLGGGGYLYVLLLLVCVNALVLSEAQRRNAGRQAIAAAVTLGALPAGWWLLNQGLEAHVEKYELVYSGVQFLLGPDRSRLLSTEALMLRWLALQAAVVLVLAAGLVVGRRGPQPRDPVSLPSATR